uniref:Multicopper oxidase 5 n=1 Tax=Plautia stali TaxID=106108 RepID=A0A5A4UBE1_PLAST|nr:multicopper oxidase 5 [Plautia stali]
MGFPDKNRGSTNTGKKHYDRKSQYMPPNTTNHCFYPYRNIYDWELTPVELCKRPCDGKPKVCHLTLYIEQFTTFGVACLGCPETMEKCFNSGCISANGFPRSIITANRQMPAPPIEICQKDTLVVDVVNIMHESTTTIHWHGLRQMDGGQYYDGVPYITQCPIPPGNKFRYMFKVTECGSFWYHSHTGMQRLDGLVGALIVRCIHEPLEHLYHNDNNTLMIIDWTLAPTRNLISGFTIYKQNLSPDTILINGKAPHYDETSNTFLPVSIITVEAGKKSRIRIIGSCSFTCAYAVQFEGHPVTIITLDGGHKIKPLSCDTVVVNAAERFDVVLNANQRSDQLYLILMQGVGPCKNVKSYAILKYSSYKKPINFTETELKSRTMFPLQLKKTCNAVETTCAKTRSKQEKENDICIVDMEGDCDTPPIDPSNRYMCPLSETYIFDFSLTPITRDHYEIMKYEQYFRPGLYSILLATVNNVIFSNPSTTLLGSAKYNPPGTFCNYTCLDRNIKKGMPCECTAVYQISLRACVTLIMRFKSNILTHPVHIHGYNAQIAFQEGGPEYVNMTDDELLRLAHSNRMKSKCRPIKDVITVPRQGVVIMQFIADNPGYWFLHCHWSFHGELGMALVLKVGNSYQLPPKPFGFPSCRDFVPNCV